MKKIFFLIALCLLVPGVTLAQTNNPGDLDGNGVVNIQDVTFLVQNWLTSAYNSFNFANILANWTQPTSVPSPTPVTANKTAFQIGPGGSDTIPHQIVRTINDYVYIFGYGGDTSNKLYAYRSNSPGFPNSATDFSNIQTTYTANILSVDTAYDGDHIIHVFVNDQNGNLSDRPLDTTSNTFKPLKTLVTNNPSVQGTYVGTSGISSTVNNLGKIQIVYWSAGNHITYAEYSYNLASDTLILSSGPTQVDGSESTNNNHPVMAISPVDNSTTVAWVSGSSGAGNIFIRTRSGAGSWDTAAKINAAPAWTDPNNGLNIDQGPSLLITSDGTKHLAYIENWRSSAPFDYGRIHYVKNSGSGWTDQYTGSYSHDPTLATNSAGDLYILGHGWALNPGVCTDNNVMCIMKKNPDGTWGNQQILINKSATATFDSSPSVKWSRIGWNKPEIIEYVVPNVNAGYVNSFLYYGRF